MCSGTFYSDSLSWQGKKFCLLREYVVSNFFGESFAELKKVVWPSWSNVKKSAKVVIVSTVIFACFFGLLDFLFTKLLVVVL